MDMQVLVPLHKLAVDENITYHLHRLRHNASDTIFDEIADAFQGESHLLSVSAHDLRRSFYEGCAVVALANLGQKPVGFTRISQIVDGAGGDESWFELGSTWVHGDYRHRGINRTMYELLLACHRNKNVLATTTNEHSLMLGESIGLVLRKRKDLPENVWKASCVCAGSKMGAGCAEHCARAFGEPQQQGANCYFRVTAETAKRIKC